MQKLTYKFVITADEMSGESEIPDSTVEFDFSGSVAASDKPITKMWVEERDLTHTFVDRDDKPTINCKFATSKITC